MMNRVVMLSILLWLVVGCAAPSGSGPDVDRDRARAAICAESWRAKGFAFDPNTMTCEQMFERAQAIRNAAYWRQQGYAFDPNIMTAGQMDRRAAEFRKSGVKQYPPALTAPAEAAEAETTAPETAPEVAPVPQTAPQAVAPIQPQDLATRRMLEKMTITQVRRKYPQYNDMDDMELTDAIHERYFRDVPSADFARRFLGQQP